MSLDLRHIRLRSIAAGLLTDIGGTIVSLILAEVILSCLAAAKHVSVEEYGCHLASGPIFQILYTINGLMFSCAGALVTSMLARPYCTLNALLFGIFTTLTSLCFFTDKFDVSTMATCIIIPPMCVLVSLFVSRSSP